MNKNKITKDAVIQRNPDMVASKMDGETVMMSLGNSEYYGLNEIGSRIWDIITEKIQVDKLIELLTNEYDVAHDACEEDVMFFLDRLQEKGLLIVSG